MPLKEAQLNLTGMKRSLNPGDNEKSILQISKPKLREVNSVTSVRGEIPTKVHLALETCPVPIEFCQILVTAYLPKGKFL